MWTHESRLYRARMRWGDHETTKARQVFFDTVAHDLVGRTIRPLPPWAGSRPMSGQFAFFGDGATLAIASWPGASQASIDEALAWGLAWGGDRDVVLFLPAGRAGPTLQRLPWVAVPVRVFEVPADEPLDAHPVLVPARGEVLDEIRRWGPRGSGKIADLPPERAEWIKQLLAWIDSKPELSPRHRQSYLSWHVGGRQVLRITGSPSSVTIEAGVRYSNPAPDQPPPLPPVVLGTSLKQSQLESICAAVEGAVQRRASRLDAGHEEHLLQHALDSAFLQQGRLLGLTKLYREFPAWRPGRSPAYIDFLGADDTGRPHVVEVKLGNDVMLALQGLDYWIWATANTDLLTKVLGATPSAGPMIDFVVGAHGSSKVMGPYTLRQLEGLDGAIRWRFHVVADWTTTLEIRSLPPRQTPGPPEAWEPAMPWRHALRLHDHLASTDRTSLSSRSKYFSTPGGGIVPEALPAWHDLQARGLLHRHANHLRSSQAFALNMLAGLDHSQRSAIVALAGITDVTDTSAVTFEMEDDLDRLGEATKASPHRTQVDAAIVCASATGLRTELLIEVKLSEVDFGHCSAYQSAHNDRRDVCASDGAFGNDPEHCFQLRNHDREHRRTYDIQLGPTPATGNGCSFRLGTNQPMRNVALGRAIVLAGETDQVVHALLAPAANSTIWRRWAEAKIALHGIPHVRLADLPAELVLGVHQSERRAELAQRYRLGDEDDPATTASPARAAAASHFGPSTIRRDPHMANRPIHLAPPDAEAAQRAIDRLRASSSDSESVCDRLDEALCSGNLPEEILIRHSCWCDTEGRYSAGVDAAREAARALYGFVPERLLDTGRKRHERTGHLLTEYRQRIEGV